MYIKNFLINFKMKNFKIKIKKKVKVFVDVAIIYWIVISCFGIVCEFV
jgi:hypothetical protein